MHSAQSLMVEPYHGDGAEWDAFVNAAQSAVAFHRWGWREVICRAYGHRPLYLVARRGPTIEGLLPLFEVKALFVGKVLLSIPCADYAGICAATQQAGEALAAAAGDLARDRGASYVELRHLDRPLLDLPAKTSRVAVILHFQESPEAQWQAFSKNIRHNVRRAGKCGLTFALGGPAQLATWYNLYARAQQQIGVPMHAAAFFTEMLRMFSDGAVMFVEHEGRPIAAAIAVFFGETMEVGWLATPREHFALFPNNLLYWEAIKLGFARGCRQLAFGRSPPGSGPYEFKMRWGSRAHDLYYQYIAGRSQHLPTTDEPRSGRFDLAQRLWRRLPASIVRRLGPTLFKRLPW